MIAPAIKATSPMYPTRRALSFLRFYTSHAKGVRCSERLPTLELQVISRLLETEDKIKIL